MRCTSTKPRRVVVVIDHHAAHIFRDVDESRPQNAVGLTPYDSPAIPNEDPLVLETPACQDVHQSPRTDESGARVLVGHGHRL